MLIPFWFIKYIVAFNIVYWPVRQFAPDSVSIWVAFASWPLVWYFARRRRQQRWYEAQALAATAEESD